MTRISFIPNINLSELPKIIPQALKNIDIKVGACFAIALGVVILLVVRKMMQPSKPAIFQASADKLGFSEEELKKTDTITTLMGRTETEVKQPFSFKHVCDATIDAIRSESLKEGNKNLITINNGIVIYFLTLGLSEQNYQAAADKDKS